MVTLAAVSLPCWIWFQDFGNQQRVKCAFKENESCSQDPIARMLGGLATFRQELTVALLGAGGLIVYGGAMAVAARGLKLSLARS